MVSNELTQRPRKKGMHYQSKNLRIGTLKTLIYNRPCGRRIIATESHVNSGHFVARCVKPGVEAAGRFPWYQVCYSCLIDLIEHISTATCNDRTLKGQPIDNDWRLPGETKIYTADV